MGRHAFRRFRDTIHDFPDLLTHWSTYARAEARAIEWLGAEGYADDADAGAELARRAATLEVTLSAAGQSHDLPVEVDTVKDRWGEVEQTLDAGYDVTLLRDGRPWATIAPA